MFTSLHLQSKGEEMMAPQKTCITLPTCIINAEKTISTNTIPLYLVHGIIKQIYQKKPLIC